MRAFIWKSRALGAMGALLLALAGTACAAGPSPQDPTLVMTDKGAVRGVATGDLLSF